MMRTLENLKRDPLEPFSIVIYEVVHVFVTVQSTMLLDILLTIFWLFSQVTCPFPPFL